jgi:hypothetical protein
MEPIVLFGGKFPLSGGVPAIYSAADIEECCCPPPPAPCECPCETWPPESWPCGGLLEEYAVDIFLRFTEYESETECTGSPFAIFEWRVKGGPGVVSADTTCGWADAELVMEQRAKIGDGPFTEWEEITPSATVELTEINEVCAWKFLVLGYFFFKDTGSSPIGSYKFRDHITGTGTIYESGQCYPADLFWGAAHFVEYTVTVS